MATVSIRYIVDDVDKAIQFYCRQLGFREEMHPAPSFAMLSRGDLRLALSAPGGGPGGGGQAMPDGRLPEPGGWNRFQLEVSDLAGLVESLRERGARFRSGWRTLRRLGPADGYGLRVRGSSRAAGRAGDQKASTGRGAAACRDVPRGG